MEACNWKKLNISLKLQQLSLLIYLLISLFTYFFISLFFIYSFLSYFFSVFLAPASKLFCVT